MRVLHKFFHHFQINSILIEEKRPTRCKRRDDIFTYGRTMRIAHPIYLIKAYFRSMKHFFFRLMKISKGNPAAA
jgi:hypothetical protein